MTQRERILAASEHLEPDRVPVDLGTKKSVLTKGAVQEVKHDVKHRLELFMPGDGFGFNTAHNILPEAPPQNSVAMFEAIQEFNR